MFTPFQCRQRILHHMCAATTYGTMMMTTVYHQTTATLRGTLFSTFKLFHLSDITRSDLQPNAHCFAAVINSSCIHIYLVYNWRCKVSRSITLKTRLEE